MKGLYKKNFRQQETILVEGEDFHHLIHVMRFREGDQICLLDGEGNKSIATIEKLSKKNFILKPKNIFFEEKKKQPKIILCVSKAFQDCLHIAVECGLDSIYYYYSEYSQKISLKRVGKIIKQAMEQSLNPYYLELILLDQLPSSLTICTTEKKTQFQPTDYYLIGPEGGFSEQELSQASSFLHFSTSILKTPTALSYALGFLKKELE